MFFMKIYLGHQIQRGKLPRIPWVEEDEVKAETWELQEQVDWIQAGQRFPAELCDDLERALAQEKQRFLECEDQLRKQFTLKEEQIQEKVKEIEAFYQEKLVICLLLIKLHIREFNWWST